MNDIQRNNYFLKHSFLRITNQNVILTAIVKFFKYVVAKDIQSRSLQDNKDWLHEISVSLGPSEKIVIDNEKSFGSAPIKYMLESQPRDWAIPFDTLRNNALREQEKCVIHWISCSIHSSAPIARFASFRFTFLWSWVVAELVISFTVRY